MTIELTCICMYLFTHIYVQHVAPSTTQNDTTAHSIYNAKRKKIWLICIYIIIHIYTLYISYVHIYMNIHICTHNDTRTDFRNILPVFLCMPSTPPMRSRYLICIWYRHLICRSCHTWVMAHVSKNHGLYASHIFYFSGAYYIHIYMCVYIYICI